MPQIIVDTSQESSRSLRMVALLLQDYSNLKLAEEQQQEKEFAKASAEANALLRGIPDTPLVASPPLAPLTAGPLEPDPVAVFGKNNVLPFTAPTPPATGATAPSVTSAMANTSVAELAAAAPAVTASNAPIATLEYDSAGIPWDARIHQASKNKKKGDQTWMLKRGLDPQVAAAILAEITPTPGAVAPVTSSVTVPPGATAGPSGVFVPPAPGNAAAGGVPAPLAPVANVPVPPAPPAGGVPAAPLSPVMQFRQMMQKIGAALGTNSLTQDQVDTAVRAAGVNSIQAVLTQPQLIPGILAALKLG